MNNDLMNTRLKIFLSDMEIRKKYNIDDKTINEVTMTSPEDNLIIVLIRSLLQKENEEQTERIAASRLNDILDNRLIQLFEKESNVNS